MLNDDIVAVKGLGKYLKLSVALLEKKETMVNLRQFFKIKEDYSR